MRPASVHPPRAPALVPALAVAVLAAGCAHVPVSPVLPAAPRAAFVPLEDLSGRPGAAERLSAVVFTALAATHRCRLVEPGEVAAAMDAARIRTSGVLTREQTRSLAGRLEVRWIVTGNVLEFGHVRTPDGEVPSVGVALRVIDGPDGSVAWAGQRHRTGEDRESIFGWGRISSLERLAERTAAELVGSLRFPDPSDSSSSRKGVP